MIRSLLRKEWREHRWKMSGMLAMYLFVILAAFIHSRAAANPKANQT